MSTVVSTEMTLVKSQLNRLVAKQDQIKQDQIQHTLRNDNVSPMSSPVFDVQYVMEKIYQLFCYCH